MSDYHDLFNALRTPQTSPIPGKNMVQGRSGGYLFEVSDWELLDRFLLLGTVQSTYYATGKDLTMQAADLLIRLLADRGTAKRAIDRALEVSQKGLALRNEPALFLLAMAMSPQFSIQPIRAYAGAVMPDIARTTPHLIKFVQYVTALRGWGRQLRNAVADWYLSKDPKDLVYQVMKYHRKIEGWDHLDLIRQAHPKPVTATQQAVFAWLANHEDMVQEEGQRMIDVLCEFPYFEGTLKLRGATDAAGVASLVKEYHLTQEVVPSNWQEDDLVVQALFEEMPIHAMIRNLARMTRRGILATGIYNYPYDMVLEKLGDQNLLHRSRIHPMALFLAGRTYAAGVSPRNYDTRWDPVPDIVDALDKAFYMAYQNVEPTGQRLVIGVDCSGSMSYPMQGLPNMTARQTAVALSLVLANQEPKTTIYGFTGKGFQLPITKAMPLNVAIDEVDRRVEPCTTDASQPFQLALTKGVEADAFVIITDNESWSGNRHPSQALEEYRKKTGLKTKMAVLALTSDRFSIADPSDWRQMNFVGMDSSIPQALNIFLGQDSAPSLTVTVEDEDAIGESDEA